MQQHISWETSCYCNEEYAAYWNQHGISVCFGNGLLTGADLFQSTSIFRPTKLLEQMANLPKHVFVLLFEQIKVRTPPLLFRRNSFDPLSTEYQIKRPRMYSMSNVSPSPALPPPAFPSTPISKGIKSLQREVSVQ